MYGVGAHADWEKELSIGSEMERKGMGKYLSGLWIEKF
jgi:hypothetical protein